MFFQRVFTTPNHIYRLFALLALAIVAPVATALIVNFGAGHAEEPAPHSLTITSATAGAVTDDSDPGDSRKTYAYSINEGQDVTLKIELADDVTVPDGTKISLQADCDCIWDAGFVSYTTGVGASSAVTHPVSHLPETLLLQDLNADALPLALTVKGMRVSRRIFTKTGATIGTKPQPRPLWITIYWMENGRLILNRDWGFITVNERPHPADESTHQYLRITNADDVMKGERLTYNVELVDRSLTPVIAAQAINLAVNSRSAYPRDAEGFYTPLIDQRVTIPSGASSVTIEVPTTAGAETRPVEPIHVKAWLVDHPSGVKFLNPFAYYDALGRIVDGTEFTFVEMIYSGIEGSNLAVVVNVDGNVSVGAFGLRLHLQFWSNTPGFYNSASLADFVGGDSHYDCSLTPTREGSHVLHLPILEDNLDESREAFRIFLQLINTPDNARGFTSVHYSETHSFGVIDEAPPGQTSTPPPSDCVAVESSSSVPSSEPLQSPISFSTTAITLAEGSSFSYDVTLNSDPGDQTVTVQPVSMDEATIKTPAEISFTSANWNQPQAVVVTAESDGDSDDEQVGIGHIVDGVSGAPVGPVVFATVTEQPTVGLDIRQPTQRSFGDQPFFAYWIRLDRQPSSDVEIELAPASDSVDVQLHTNSLSFTAENWDRYQIVVLKPLDSTVGNELKITHGATTHIINSGELVSATISGD